MRFSIIRVIAAAGVLAALAVSQAHAQAWPQKPIRLVVPFGPAGGTDVLARLLAQKMSEGLGQPVVVENKAGAGGSVGTAEVAKAAPDGYTILLGTSSTHGINPSLYPKLPYDPVKDFSPVALIAVNKFVAVVPASTPARNLQEFIAMVRRDPGKHSYASSGNGTTSHLAGALFVHMAGAPMSHVPYKTTGAAQIDLIAGRVALMFDNITAMQGHLQSGALRALATTSTARSPILRDVPTAQEQGLKGYQIDGWFCFLAPAGTPADVVNRLHRETERVVALPEVTEKMIAIGADPQVLPPAGLRKMIATEIPRWRDLISATGAKVE